MADEPGNTSTDQNIAARNDAATSSVLVVGSAAPAETELTTVSTKKSRKKARMAVDVSATAEGILTDDVANVAAAALEEAAAIAAAAATSGEAQVDEPIEKKRGRKKKSKSASLETFAEDANDIAEQPENADFVDGQPFPRVSGWAAVNTAGGATLALTQEQLQMEGNVADQLLAGPEDNANDDDTSAKKSKKKRGRKAREAAGEEEFGEMAPAAGEPENAVDAAEVTEAEPAGEAESHKKKKKGKGRKATEEFAATEDEPQLELSGETAAIMNAPSADQYVGAAVNEVSAADVALLSAVAAMDGASAPLGETGEFAAAPVAPMATIHEDPFDTPRTKKSKTASAYERKRKRLEAAALAGDQAAKDPYSMDIPEEEAGGADEDGAGIMEAGPSNYAIISTPASKRKKRRMPDVNGPLDTPVRNRATTDGGEEGEERRKKSASRSTPYVKPYYTDLNPQPGTTDHGRKRPSYSYAPIPDPTPDNLPSNGIFTQPECASIDHYLSDFQNQHNLTSFQLNARIWGDYSMLPDQPRNEREAFWKELYALLPHRKRLAIYNHVRRRYHNFDVQGAKWDDEHDAQLRQCVETHGSKWTVIGKEMGRLPDDCRDRWRNYVKCGQERHEKEWTDEEESRLRDVIAGIKARLRAERGDDPDMDHGNLDSAINWTAVSDLMGGTRSRIQCRYKWQKMREWENGAPPKRRQSEAAGGSAKKRRGPAPKPRGAAAVAQLQSLNADQQLNEQQLQMSATADDEQHEFPGLDPETGIITGDAAIDPALQAMTLPTIQQNDGGVDDAAEGSKKLRAKKKALKARKGKAQLSADTVISDDELDNENEAELDDADNVMQEYNVSSDMLANMKTGDRIWLLEQIKRYAPNSTQAIPFSTIAKDTHYFNSNVLEAMFVYLFRQSYRTQAERDSATPLEICDRVLEEYYSLPEHVRAERYIGDEGAAGAALDAGGDDSSDDGVDVIPGAVPTGDEDEAAGGKRKRGRKGKKGKKGKKDDGPAEERMAETLLGQVEAAMQQGA